MNMRLGKNNGISERAEARSPSAAEVRFIHESRGCHACHMYDTEGGSDLT